MDLSLTPEPKQVIETCLESELYTSASKCVGEAVRFYFRYDAARWHEIQAQKAYSGGLNVVDRGEGVPELEMRRFIRRAETRNFSAVGLQLAPGTPPIKF